MTKGVRDQKRSSVAWVLPAIAGILAVSVFFLVAGRGTHHVATGTHSSSSPAAAKSGPLEVGKPAPEIHAVAFDGTNVDLNSLRGKVVLVNFFASWCSECRAEIPDIEKMYKAKRAAGFEVIAVNTWELGDGPAFLSGLGGTYPAVSDPQTALDRPGPIAASYGLTTVGLPISVFIDRIGNVHQVYPGRIDAGNIAGELHQMGIG